jgi:phosphoribosyl-ATP pyrophosphohydrolase/phosphoribosyl-AMP cyclohydrolase
MDIDFEKSDGLVPAIVQDSKTLKVLMLGYMNAEALAETHKSGKVTFFSRSKQRLWTKGESSGNFLLVDSIKVDCDNDALLIKVQPQGPTCHTGNATCFESENSPNPMFLTYLEDVIEQRRTAKDSKSYVASLFEKGLNKIAQKVGEEAIELVIEAKDNDESLFLNEAADLLFHYLILLKAKGHSLNDVIEILDNRHK